MCGNLKIIGVVGATAAGKSTLSKTLESAGYTRLAMAKPLKDMLKALGLSKQDLYGPPAHRATPSDFLCGKSPRHAMVTLGTEWARRLIGPDLWVNAIQEQIIAHQTRAATKGEPGFVVIEDIRFPNEWRMIERLGGTIWRVRRPDVEVERGFLCHLANSPVRWKRWIGVVLQPLLRPFGLKPVHESEYHWPDAPADAEFWNTGTEADLAAQVRDMLTRCAPTCEGDQP